MIAITPAQKQRTLALLVLALAIALAWLVFLHPLINIAIGESEEAESSLNLLARYQALEAARPQVEAELREMQQRNAAMSGLFEGKSAALAAAAVQSDVKTIVESNGGTVLSSQNIPPTAADGFEKIEIQYDISVPLGSLKNIIYQIETHTPFLFIDSVNMRMPENWQPGNGTGPAPAMEAQWVVRAYRWVGAR